MQIIDNKNNAVLLKLVRGKIYDKDSDAGGGAYGASLGTSATQQRATWGGGATTRDLFQMNQDKYDGSAISLEKKYYFINDGVLIEADKKSIEKSLTKELKEEWGKFLKSKKINFKKEDNLVQVLEFLAK
jgi:hypothetical protein